MTSIQYFSPQPTTEVVPTGLGNLLNDTPHPLAIKAAELLQKKLCDSLLLSNNLLGEGNGKMFGVLVVADPSGKPGYISAFSGMLDQQWIVPDFVPPLFNIEQQSAFLREGEAKLESLSTDISRLVDDPEYHDLARQIVKLIFKSQQELVALKHRNRENKKIRQTKRRTAAVDDSCLLQALSLSSQQDKRELKQLRLKWQEKLDRAQGYLNQNFENKIENFKTERQQLSQQLHDKVFETYRLKNALGEEASVRSLFDGKALPGGTGDCAAPKLFQYAFQNNLTPLALAEFWWGGSPESGVRHHGEFYPPCRGKCQPILPFMLKGLDVQLMFFPEVDTRLEPDIIYQDGDIVVLNKPSGLLSIPGKEHSHSVSDWLAKKFPDATGPLLVHRLDMATSGLLLATKNPVAHKILQKQFLCRTVKKRYVAVLSRSIELTSRTLDLPLRVDLDDRPRQVVCYRHGKTALTEVEVISTDNESSRVYFYPLTGRTHQLRVHAAHSLGLSAPIVGDELYGVRSGRMLLHADSLSFNHPLSGNRMTFESEVPF